MFFGISSTNKLISFAIKESLYNSLIVPNVISFFVLLILVTCGLSVVGQIGDLSASAIKRYAVIKDYSDLIPGHGGMVDRVDSVIFIAPFTYLFFILIF